jgi:hypothetical protein
VVDERRLCLVQVADIVFGWILRAARIQQCPDSVLEFERVVAFADNVVLMKHVTEKVPVIELVDDRLRDVGSLRLSATSSATISSTSRRWIAR